MTRVLVTGATGYIGGALVARLLSDGHQVIALSRNDEHGERTRQSVLDAARGFGLESNAAATALRVLPATLDGLPADAFWDLDAVWHCAAEMSFASRRLESSFATNVGDTHALYKHVARHARGRPRFNYVSTAYTGGIQADEIGEELHLAPKLVNPYFVSKWCAEMTLAELSRTPNSLPVTLFRPTIVVGHSQTGWYGGKSFGPYNFIDAFHVSTSLGNRSMRVDIDPEVSHNYLAIDDLVENAATLTTGGVEQPPLSILHALGSEMSNRERTAIIAEEMGVKVVLARPKTVGDHALATWVSANKRFNEKPAVIGRFPFVGGNLKRMLGERYSEHPIDVATLRKLTRWYCDNRLSAVARRWKPAVRVPLALMRFLHASGLERAVLPKTQSARLLLGGMARAYLMTA
jgi:nucleoside-diphosphate-sugar epimerase